MSRERISQTDAIIAASKRLSGSVIVTDLNEGCTLVTRPSAAWGGDQHGLMEDLRSAHGIHEMSREQKRDKGKSYMKPVKEDPYTGFKERIDEHAKILERAAKLAAFMLTGIKVA